MIPLSYKYLNDPAEEPVSLEQAKLHLRVDEDADDTQIAALITAAREYGEEYQRRCYINRRLNAFLPCLPKELKRIELPRSPLVSITSITIYYEDGTSAVVDPSFYGVDLTSTPGAVYLKEDCEWPETPDSTILRGHSPVVIEFTAGYGENVALVPQRVKQAMLLLIGHYYMNREDSVVGLMVSKLPKGATALLGMDKVY